MFRKIRPPPKKKKRKSHRGVEIETIFPGKFDITFRWVLTYSWNPFFLLSPKKYSRSSDPMTACYISSSYPALLHFIWKYGSNPSVTDALLASTNAGGENVARSIVLGNILGLLHGFENIPTKFITGLIADEEINNEFEGLVESFHKQNSNEEN